MTPKWLSGLFLAGLIFASLSCKTPFSTREPETPNASQSNWVQPTSPNYVMINLRTAVTEKNSQNYLRCLADTGTAAVSFRYIPESSVAAANPGLFQEWSKESERNYLNQLLAYLPGDSLSTLTLTLIRENAFQDSVVLVQDYVLTLGHKQQSAGCPRQFRGQAEFRLRRSDEDLWYIYRWSDFATADQPAWSVLRAFFGK